MKQIKDVNRKPNLRFPEFKKDWEEKKLGKLCSTFKSGFGITSERISDKGKFPVYGGNGLRGYSNTFTHDGFYVLIGRQGALCGNINRAYGKSYISEHAIAVSANKNSDTEWLAQKLDYLKLNRLSESSAQPGLAVNRLVKLKLVVPSLPEQQKIAAFLSAVDKKIQLLTRKKELLEQYKKGVMQKIFSREIRFKDENGNDYPDWEEKRLGEILTIKYGKEYKNLGSGNIPVLGTGGIIAYVCEFLYDKPSVLIGRKGTINSPQFIEEPFWTVDTLFYSEIKSGYDPYFVFLIAFSINWMKYNEATGVPSLNTTSINSVKVKIPNSLDEQNAYSARP